MGNKQEWEFYQEDLEISVMNDEGVAYVAVDLDDDRIGMHDERSSVHTRITLDVETVDLLIVRLKKAKAAAVRANKLAGVKF